MVRAYLHLTVEPIERVGTWGRCYKQQLLRLTLQGTVEAEAPELWQALPRHLVRKVG